MNKYNIIFILLVILVAQKIITIMNVEKQYKNNILINEQLLKLYSKSLDKYLNYNRGFLNNKPWKKLYQHPSFFYNKVTDYGPFPDKTKINNNSLYLSLEKNYKMIKKELYNYIGNKDISQIKSNTFLPEKHIHDGKWKNTVLFYDGFWNKDSDLFPETKKILSEHIDKCYGHISFSLLPANSKIYPHSGVSNFRLRLHLGLTIPDNYKDCYIKNADKKGFWREGKVLVVDDSYLHSVNNNTNQDRIILIFDIWNPSISLMDKFLIKRIN